MRLLGKISKCTELPISLGLFFVQQTDVGDEREAVRLSCLNPMQTAGQVKKCLFQLYGCQFFKDTTVQHVLSLSQSQVKELLK